MVEKKDTKILIIILVILIMGIIAFGSQSIEFYIGVLGLIGIMAVPLVIMISIAGLLYLIQKIFHKYILAETRKTVIDNKKESSIFQRNSDKKRSVIWYLMQAVNYYSIIIIVGFILEEKFGGPGGAFIMVTGLTIGPAGALLLPLATDEIRRFFNNKGYHEFSNNIFGFHLMFFVAIVVLLWVGVFIM